MQNITKFNTMHHRIYHKKNYHEFHNEIIEINKFYHQKKIRFDIDNNEQIYQIFSHHFVQKKYNAKQLKFLILNRFIRYQKILKAIISDKNKFFTFNY